LGVEKEQNAFSVLGAYCEERYQAPTVVGKKTNNKKQNPNSKLTTLCYVDLRYAPIPKNKFPSFISFRRAGSNELNVSIR